MKKISILILTFILLLSANGNAQILFNTVTMTPSDINEHWAEGAMQTLKELGIMNGFNSVINPDSIITRGEFTALITRAFGIEASPLSEDFTDINEDHIFYQNICAASQAGIIDGFPDSTFRPGNMITREEIMLIISRLHAGGTGSRVIFSDIDSTYRYYNQLSKIYNDGIINGYPDGSFRPYGKTTRAEAASIVLSAMKKYLPSSSSDNITNIALEYLQAHFSKAPEISHLITGEAETERKYIDYTYAYCERKGFTVSNSIYSPDIISIEHYGPFSIVKAEYHITNSINNHLKEYKGSSEIGIITRHGKSKIFRHCNEIIFEGKINLTWEALDALSQKDSPGVNIVSPTCFVISPKNDTSDFVSLGSDSEGYMFFNSSLTTDYVKKAKEKKYDIWAMYKSDFTTSTATRFLNNEQFRKYALDNLMDKILMYELDGINFDFENMLPTDRGAYTNHVKEVSLIAHTLGIVTSVDITKYSPYSANWSMCFDRDALAKYADYIILMAYDQHYAGSKTPGPVAGFEWTEKSINLTLKEVSPQKIVLAMPYYIRFWKAKNGKTVSSKAISMSTAIEYVNSNNAISIYDNNHKMLKYTWTDGKNEYLLWMENADTIRRRVQMANSYGLAGVASWRKGFETPDVWHTIENELNSLL